MLKQKSCSVWAFSSLTLTPACEAESLVASEVARRNLAALKFHYETFSVVEAKRLVSDRPRVFEDRPLTQISSRFDSRSQNCWAVSRFVGLSVRFLQQIYGLQSEQTS